jgi:hypothetical protein
MDGTSILITVQAIEPGILSAMKAVIAKKAELVGTCRNLPPSPL